MGKALSRRAKKSNRRVQAVAKAVAAAECAIRAANDASRITPVRGADGVADISGLKVSVTDVQAAGTATETLVWYVARCEPASERKALSSLRERRVSAYMPIERRCRWSRGRKSTEERPLLIGYLFVGLPTERHQHLVRDASGVEGLVGVAGVARPIDPWAVFAFAAAEAAGLFDHSGEKKPAYKAGQDVRVVGGQFAGFIAKVIEANGDRVRILFEGLFAGSPITLKDDHVAAVEMREAA